MECIINNQVNGMFGAVNMSKRKGQKKKAGSKAVTPIKSTSRLLRGTASSEKKRRNKFSSSEKMRGPRPNTQPSVANQGDHGTAYALVRRGGDRVLGDIEGLSEDIRRNPFLARQKIYTFVKRLSSLLNVVKDMSEDMYDKKDIEHEKHELDQMVSSISELMEDYGEIRSRKKGLEVIHSVLTDKRVLDLLDDIFIEKMTAILDEKGSSDLDSLARELKRTAVIFKTISIEDLIEEMKALKKPPTANDLLRIAKRNEVDYHSGVKDLFYQQETLRLVLINKKCEFLLRAGMTFYNRLHHTAFNPSKKSASQVAGKQNRRSERLAKKREKKKTLTRVSGEEVPSIQASLARLDDAYTKGHPEAVPIEELQMRIYSLLDYKQIIPEKSSRLGKGKKAKGTLKLRPGNRGNNPDDLAMVIAKHLYLFFSVYPEASEGLNCSIFNEDSRSQEIAPQMKGLMKGVFDLVLEDWPMYDLPKSGRRRAAVEAKREQLFSDVDDCFQSLVEARPDERLDNMFKEDSSSSDNTHDGSDSEEELDASDTVRYAAMETPQQGWNCFDIAIGLVEHYSADGLPRLTASQARRRLVNQALGRSEDLEFRRLIASEVRHAAALTVTYMIVKDQEAEFMGDPKKIARLAELFEIQGALSGEGADDKAQVEKQIRELLADASKVTVFPPGCLPEGMRTPRLKRVVVGYFDAHEKLRTAVATINANLDEDGQIAQDDLDAFFSSEENRTSFSEQFEDYQTANQAHLAFDGYCVELGVYESYVNGYYGVQEDWFSFQRRAAGEHSTSMVDVTARILDKGIDIIDEDGAYLHRANPDAVDRVSVVYNGTNHFYTPGADICASVAAKKSGAVAQEDAVATPPKPKASDVKRTLFDSSKKKTDPQRPSALRKAKKKSIRSNRVPPVSEDPKRPKAKGSGSGSKQPPSAL